MEILVTPVDYFTKLVKYWHIFSASTIEFINNGIDNVNSKKMPCTSEKRPYIRSLKQKKLLDRYSSKVNSSYKNWVKRMHNFDI